MFRLSFSLCLLILFMLWLYEPGGQKGGVRLKIGVTRIFGGIYDMGLKRAFMGYIGLLLNAPYKIDSMVWMRLWIWLVFRLFFRFCYLLCLAIQTGSKMACRSLR
jgi:hypothetical protein